MVRYWSWTLRRLALSAFLVVHMTATAIWVMPPCPIRARCIGTAIYYMYPLGLWQYWGMFAPDPVRNSVTLEAEVVDARGLRHTFAFPKVADYGAWHRVPRFRHMKFAYNLGTPDSSFEQEIAARHAVRQLELPSEAFPLDVHLIHLLRPVPPPGSPPVDPMALPQRELVCSHQFNSLDEVRP